MAGDDKPNKFAELTPALAVIGTIAGAPLAFLKASGFADDLGAAYGVAVKELLWVVTCGAALAIALVFLWYFETLGGVEEAAGSGLRERFDRERARLAEYRAADDGYAQKLKAFLAWIDRFFDGDEKPPQHARILNDPAHIWTAASFDRCLLLALVYPIIAIFLSWAIAGHIGPAEAALGLKEVDAWLRAGLVGAFVPISATTFKLARGKGFDMYLWTVAYFLSLLFAFSITFVGTLGFSAAVAVAFAFAFAGAGIGAGAVAFAGAFVASSIFGFLAVLAHALAIAAGGMIAVGAVATLSIRSRRGRWRGLFLGVFCALMISLCLLVARTLSAVELTGYDNWNREKSLLLFLGLFTLVNAPFDWLSLGLTRLLLRYGIEKGGYWPYALAVVDAVVASALITILALAMAWSSDLLNFLAQQGGGEHASVLPPSRFYLGMLESDPAAPEFWWLYATLFSTMIPSVINLFIAGFSFLRTLPWSRSFLLSNMREGETMPVVARLISSSILTAQVTLAWPLAIAAQVFLTYVVLWQIMPRLGLGILHLVETLSL